MAVFHAFKALRPAKEKAADVAALPYDVVNREEAKAIGDENPLSFLHVDRPEMDLEPEIDLYDERVYEKAKENLAKMSAKNMKSPKANHDEEPFIFSALRAKEIELGNESRE